MSVCLSVCMFVGMYVRTYVCIDTQRSSHYFPILLYIYKVCIYIYMCKYVCVYIYICDRDYVDATTKNVRGQPNHELHDCQRSSLCELLHHIQIHRPSRRLPCSQGSSSTCGAHTNHHQLLLSKHPTSYDPTQVRRIPTSRMHLKGLCSVSSSSMWYSSPSISSFPLNFSSRPNLFNTLRAKSKPVAYAAA